MQVAFVYISVPSELEARSIGHQLTVNRLVASYNMTTVDSCYWWNVELQDREEYVLLCKTLPSQWEKIVEIVQKMHPYEHPCIAKYMMDVPDNYYYWMKDIIEKTPT